MGGGDWIKSASESPYVPLGLLGGSAALMGVGRAGSPASTLGTSLFDRLATYYASQSILEPERKRREEAEKQQQSRLDLQTYGTLGYGPAAEGEKPDVVVKIGERTFGLKAPERIDVAQIVKGYETQFPGISQMVPQTRDPRMAVAFLQAAVPIYQEARKREGYEQTAKNVLEMGRGPSLGFYGKGEPAGVTAPPGAEAAMERPVEVRGAPQIEPQMAQAIASLYRSGHVEQATSLLKDVFNQIRDEQGYQKAMQFYAQALQGMKPGGGAQPGLSLGFGPRGPQASITLSPQSPQATTAMQAVETTKKRAAAALKDPKYLADLATVGKSNPQLARHAMELMEYAAQTGDANAWDSARKAVVPQERPLSEKEKAEEEFLKTPEGRAAYKRKFGGRDMTESQIVNQVRKLEDDLLRTKQHVVEGGRVVQRSPDRETIEEEIVDNWERLAVDYGGLHARGLAGRVKRLKQWSDDEARKWVEGFVARHPEFAKRKVESQPPAAGAE